MPRRPYIYNTLSPLSNNDQLDVINPDINLLCVNKQNICKNYDTSQDFKDKYVSSNKIAILHSNICSSEKKLSDLTYYLDNLGITFSFLGLCETWATKSNEDILN